MAGEAKSIVERLCEAGSPRDLIDWENRDGHYVAACRVSASDVPELIDIARKWADHDWPCDADVPDIDFDDAELLPVTAWRALGDLKVETAVVPLVELLRELDDEYDDWAAEELPHVFGKIGQSAIEPLTQLANDKRARGYVRSTAASGLRYIAQYHPETRDRVVSRLTEMMAGALDSEIMFNSFLLVELVKLRAVEASEPIERAFAGNLLDVGMLGDWETVRREMGVQGLGLPMPTHAYNSLADFRTIVGCGIFSDRPIFLEGDIDHDAEQAYYERAREAFSKSPEGQQVIELYGSVGWSQMLLDFGVQYFGKVVDMMTVGSVEEFVFNHMPRKVSTEPDKAAGIICELTQFWRYLDRVYELPEAPSIVKWLQTSGLADELAGELSDPANFDMAKSIFMSGKATGFDMTSQAGVAKFIRRYNQSLNSDGPPAVDIPIAKEQRVGRNDPCPCGSGKKFKKCCRQ